MNIIDRKLMPYIPQNTLFWVARVALALMFIESAADKILRWDFFIGEVTGLGIPFPAISLAAAILVEITGSIALLTGFTVIPSLLALVFYTIFLNFFYFDFWAKEGVDAIMSKKEFLKNIAIAGGLLATMLCFLRTRK